MAMVTTGGKILIHSPFNSSNDQQNSAFPGAASAQLGIAANLAQERPEETAQVRFLNTNKDIVALESG